MRGNEKLARKTQVFKNFLKTFLILKVELMWKIYIYILYELVFK
jgi:hypothetical protein